MMTGTLVTRAGSKGTLLDKLEARTDKSGGSDACWPWIGSVGQWDQPFVNHLNKTYSCRRLVWELATKSKPLPNKWIRTTCGNSRCLNPKHLALRTTKDPATKFWEKVQRGAPDECWLWMGDIQKGYGKFHGPNDRQMFAHRFSYELAHGPIEGHVGHDPEREICVCHRCDNPRCVNPAHLFLGKDRDNVHDMIAKGRNSSGAKHGEAVRRAREARANMTRLAERVMDRSSETGGTDQ